MIERHHAPHALHHLQRGTHAVGHLSPVTGQRPCQRPPDKGTEALTEAEVKERRGRAGTRTNVSHLSFPSTPRPHVPSPTLVVLHLPPPHSGSHPHNAT